MEVAFDGRIGAWRPWIGIVAVISFLGAGGCYGGEPEAGPPVTRSDSAGIEIVRNEAPAWNEGEAWRVGPDPVVRFGSADDSSAVRLLNVVDLVRLADGRWAAADAAIGGAQIYDADGQHLATTGGGGVALDPRRRLAAIDLLPGDSLLLLDGRVASVAVVDPNGEQARTVDLELPPSNPVDTLEDQSLSRALPVGRFDDGTLLARGIQHVEPADLESGVTRSTRTYLRYDPDGSYRDVLAVYPGSSAWVDLSMRTGTIQVLPLLFDAQPQHQVVGDRWFFGDGDHYEIGVHAPDGTLIRLVRRVHEPTEIGRESVADRIEERLAGVTDSSARSLRREIFREMPTRSTFPAYERFVAAEDGHLWVEGYRRPGQDPPPWSVFSSDGRWLGDVVLPTGLEPMWIDGDFVAGVWRDGEDGPETVRVYRIIKP